MDKSDLPTKVLLVDDDPAYVRAQADFLLRHQIGVQFAHDLQSALYLYNQHKFDVAVVELEFEEVPGLALLQRWRGHEVIPKRMTGFVVSCGRARTAGDDNLIKELGEIQTIQKPCTDLKLLPVMTKAMAAHRRALAAYELEIRVLGLLAKKTEISPIVQEVVSKLPELGNRGLALLARMYDQTGAYAEGLALLQKLGEKNQSNIALVNLQARMMLQLGRHQEAMQLMEKADNLAPQNIQRIEAMAQAYLEMRKPEQSCKKFKEMIRLHPDSPDMKFKIYDELYSQGYDVHACQLGKETATPMEVVRYYNNKGVALSKSGHKEEALRNYDNAVKFYPNFRENYRIYFNIALAQAGSANERDVEKARKSVEQCLKLKPDFEKARNLKDSLEARLKKGRGKSA